MEKIFPEGIRIDKPKEGSPDFVRGRIGIEVEKLIPFLEKHKNDKGWVNLDILTSREKGTLYLQLNNWKPAEKAEIKAPADYPDGPDPEGIPFN